MLTLQRTLVAVALASSSAALAVEDDPVNHYGSVGLLVAGGGQLRSANVASNLPPGLLPLLDVGATVGLTPEGGELKLVARGSGRGGALELGVYGGYRSYYGEAFKTFFDLDLALHVTPNLTIGPRAALGVQFDLTSVAGLFMTAAAQLGFGSALRFDAELLAGVQLRTFIFD